MKHIWLKIGLVFMSVTMAWSATVGTISGRITDASNGEPIIGAQVMITALGLGGSTDFEGEYYIQNIPVGMHTVQIWMIGYAKVTVNDVGVVMDQTTPVDIALEEEIIEGQEVTVVADRPLVEKDVTVKKMVRTADEIQNLPARSLSEMLMLQSGVIQVKSAEYGIPGLEDRGIEEIHVRGGRSGEIGYTIDGMYIENPIYGGKGAGSRLNTHAVQDLITQTGVFSAEYGDAMSQIVNIITAIGGDKYSGSFEFQRSDLGALSSEQDRLRNYQKYVGALSGPVIPGLKKLTFHISGDYTNSAYRVLKFDDTVYLEDDPGNLINRENQVHWLDRYAGWRSFGYDRTYDVFTRLHWKMNNYKQMNFTYWVVDSEFKTYDQWNQFFDESKNVNHSSSQRYHIEFRHQLNEKTYYTISGSRFSQQIEINVEDGDMDGDGYPDWLEYKSLTEARGFHNGVDYEGEYEIPYVHDKNFGPGISIPNDGLDTLRYESWGPGGLRTMITYYWRSPGASGATYDSSRQHIIVGHGEEIRIYPNDRITIEKDFLDEVYDGTGTLVSSRKLSNGNLIIPLMEYEYVDNDGKNQIWRYGDDLREFITEGQYTAPRTMSYPDSTYELYTTQGSMSADEFQAVRDSLYYLFNEYISVGSDRYRSFTKSVTDELKFDITSKVTKHHQLRGGIDLKRHLITYNEVQLPYLVTPYSEIYGIPLDSLDEDKSVLERFIYGNGEKSPIEIGAYLLDKIEYPWMTINAGIRFDIQNSLDSSWADPKNKSSGEVPTEWNILWSPRLSISHVITNKATFTFGYGRYYQNLNYRNIYLNNDNDLTTPSPIVGNSHVQAESVTAYEFGLNWEFVDFWKFSMVGWSKDYSDLGSTERVDAFPYSYSVIVNYDYATAAGLDFQLIKQGGTAWSTVIQYTLSRATANRADPWEGYRSSDTEESMPKKEVLMNYDRTHNLTITGGYKFNKNNSPRLFNVYPLNRTSLHLTLVALSGAPYTPWDINLERPGATNSERMPWFVETNLAARKTFSIGLFDYSLGLIVRNIFDRKNAIDIYAETGAPDMPGTQAEEAIKAGSISSTFYDRPQYYSEPRQIDLTIKVNF